MSARLKKEVLDILSVFRPRSQKAIDEINRGCGFMSDSFKKELARYLEPEMLSAFISGFDKTPTKYEQRKYSTLELLEKRYETYESLTDIIDDVLKKAETKKVALDTAKVYMNALLLKYDGDDESKRMITLAKQRIFIAMDMDKIFKTGSLFYSQLTYSEMKEKYEQWKTENEKFTSRVDIRKKLIASIYINTPTIILDYFPFRFNPDNGTVTVSEYGKEDTQQKLSPYEIELLGRVRSSDILPTSYSILFETLSEILETKNATPAFIFLTKLRDEGKLQVPEPKKREAKKKNETIVEPVKTKRKITKLTDEQKEALDSKKQVLIERIDGQLSESYVSLFTSLFYKEQSLADWFGGEEKGNRYFKSVAKNRKKHWDKE